MGLSGLATGGLQLSGSEASILVLEEREVEVRGSGVFGCDHFAGLKVGWLY